MITGFHHAALKVTDYDRALQFYQEGLGLEPCFTAGEGDERMVLFPVGSSFLEIFANGTTSDTGVVEHFAFSSDNIDADYQKALAAGATEHLAPQDIPVKATLGDDLDLRVAFVKSPTGELIEFFKSR